MEGVHQGEDDDGYRDVGGVHRGASQQMWKQADADSILLMSSHIPILIIQTKSIFPITTYLRQPRFPSKETKFTRFYKIVVFSTCCPAQHGL